MRSTPNAEPRSTPRATPNSIPDLRGAVLGRVIAPDDPDYESARLVINAAVDRRPALIVRPADAADVSLAVSLARAKGLELAIRGGGHSLAGHGTSDGGLVLDMSNMRGLHIDPQRRIAWAQAGLTAGQYTAETAQHGLTTGFGDTGSVGIAGLTLGGGIGWLVRKHGLTIDDLLAVELVSAEGEKVHVDPEQHGDLFWALRGGGGNFGVVTRLRYRLHDVSTVLGGMLILPFTPEILRSFVALADAAPDELTTIAHVISASALPFVPEDQRGRLVLTIAVVHAGDIETGERVLAPLRELASPIADQIRPMRYPQIYATPGGPEPLAMTLRSTFQDSIDERDAETVFERMRIAPSPMAAIQIRVLGGAIARIAEDATAFAHRRRRLMVNVVAAYRPHEDTSHLREWVADSFSALREGAIGAHVSFLGEEGESRVRDAYPEATYQRLVAIKRRYDPTNLFRLNQNIVPGE
jgi:FAD/FMN-containing dehydrogenase